MNVMHEIMLSDEKFAGVAALQDLLLRLDQVEYCAYGSFLSAIHFRRSFSSPFELLVKDETDTLDILSENYNVDNLHATILLDEKNGADVAASLKIKIVDSLAKNSVLRNHLIEQSESRTCVVINKAREIEKFDLQIPRRGPTILALLLEREEDPKSTTSVIEKIVWSLSRIGVAPLLRESRFVPKECVYEASDIIEDLFVTHANKTSTMLRANSTGECKNMTASELKRLGRPYAALLRA